MLTYDRLSEPIDEGGWLEPAVVAGFAEYWDRELFGLEIPPWRASVVQIVSRMAGLTPARPIVVADMGCGAGTYARHLLAAGVAFEYHGFDHNERVLRAACARWQFLPHENTHFHLMDARRPSWPIADGAFDVMIWDTTLRFCPEPAAALRESLRVSAAGAILARTPLYDRMSLKQTHYYAMSSASADWQFDERFLTVEARRSGCELTSRIGCDDTHLLSRVALEGHPPQSGIPRRERAMHEAYVRLRLAELLRRHEGAWVIFGAGEHSRWLMERFGQSLRSRVRCFVDDGARPAQEIDGINVMHPDEIRLEEVDAVLVSSDTIEAALHARAASLARGLVPVLRLYEGLPAGPYDKAPVGTMMPAPLSSVQQPGGRGMLFAGRVHLQEQ